MSLLQETQQLRERINSWANTFERSTLYRYDLLREKNPSTFINKCYKRVRRLLARFGLGHPPITSYEWRTTLKHTSLGIESKTTLLIWSVGVEKVSLRKYCEGITERLSSSSGIVPILVTDCADFAYFSRLKWLVEYIPNLSGDGESYSIRKQRYLAWRYRDALVVPASAGLANESEWNELMELKC